MFFQMTFLILMKEGEGAWRSASGCRIHRIRTQVVGSFAEEFPEFVK